MVKAFLDALGLVEEPMGVYYTDKEPSKGFAPKPGILPTTEQEARGDIDWQALFKDHACMMRYVRQARKKGTAAYFDREHFGCFAGAFYLGFEKPMLKFCLFPLWISLWYSGHVAPALSFPGEA